MSHTPQSQSRVLLQAQYYGISKKDADVLSFGKICESPEGQPVWSGRWCFPGKGREESFELRRVTAAGEPSGEIPKVGRLCGDWAGHFSFGIEEAPEKVEETMSLSLMEQEKGKDACDDLAMCVASGKNKFGAFTMKGVYDLLSGNLMMSKHYVLTKRRPRPSVEIVDDAGFNQDTPRRTSRRKKFVNKRLTENLGFSSTRRTPRSVSCTSSSFSSISERHVWFSSVLPSVTYSEPYNAVLLSRPKDLTKCRARARVVEIVSAIQADSRKRFPETIREMPRPKKCHICDHEQYVADPASSKARLLCCYFCGVIVHSGCYAVPEKSPPAEKKQPPDPPATTPPPPASAQKVQSRTVWACSRCLDRHNRKLPHPPSLRPECCLCDSPGGALKPTNDGRWAHVVCAEYLPSIGFTSPALKSEIGCVADGKIIPLRSIPSTRCNKVCCICRRTSGVCIACKAHNCDAVMHIICARSAGLPLVLFRSGVGGSSPKRSPKSPRGPRGATVVYCPRHAVSQRSPSPSPEETDEEDGDAMEVEPAVETLQMDFAIGPEHYVGDTVSGKRHGRGHCDFGNGFAYDGEWKQDQEHGRGVVTFVGGTAQFSRVGKARGGTVVFDGEFVNGVPNGKGRVVYGKNHFYDGNFKSGRRHGRGMYQYPDGSLYEGEVGLAPAVLTGAQWRGDLRHGKGKFVKKDGSSFEGDWRKDLPDGKGRLVLSSGMEYDGGMKAGLFEGRGICHYSDGSSCEGIWKGGQRDGRATYSFKNGVQYKGRFRQDDVEGTGTLQMLGPTPDGEVDWEDGGAMLIPIFFQSNVSDVHRKAGFDDIGQ